MFTPGIYNFLRLSPYHMTEETRRKVEGVMDGEDDALDYLTVQPVTSGEYIVIFDYKEIQHKDTPEDLRRIMNYAKANGANMLYFDPRTGALDELSVYGLHTNQ